MYRKMQESGLTETIPSIGTSAIWGQHPVTLTLSLLGVQHWGEGWGEWLRGLMPNILFLWVSSDRMAVMWWFDGGNILCLLMAILHSHLTESALSHGVGQRPHLASIILWFLMRNTYLVCIPDPATALLKPSEFLKWGGQWRWFLLC